jgi:HNH endonuclease
MGRKVNSSKQMLSKVTVDGDCLRWNGCKDKDGYGLSAIRGKKMPAHRAHYILTHGELTSNEYVLHKCSNRDCINIDHLYVGTQQQNVQDQIKSGTFVFGSKNGMSKLTEKLVSEIRASPLSNKYWADLLNLSYSTIWDARNRKWKLVK